MTEATQLDRMSAAIAGEHKPTPTLCCNCRKVQMGSIKDHWVKWMCTGAKNFQINYMTGQLDPPYRLCRFINYGDCAMYEEGVNQLSPDKLISDGHGGWRKPEGE
jgi:hypothetical protein